MHRFGYIANGLFVASSGVTFVFLEDIEANFGVSALGIGAISAMSYLIALLVALFLSPLGDRGHVVPLAVTAFVVGIAGNIWFGQATTLPNLLIGRALTSLGIGLFAVAARKALIGDRVEGSGEKIGGFISSAVAGFLLGPALGAQLEQFGGMRTPYLVLSSGLLLCAGPSLQWLRNAPIATSPIDSRAMIPLLKRPLIRAAAAAQAAVFLNIGVFSSTVDELLTELGASSTQVALILGAIGSPLLVLPAIAGRVVDRQPRPERVLILALVCFIPIVVGLSVWVSIIGFLMLAFVQTGLESVIFPAAARVTVNETGAGESAIGQGLLESVGQLAATTAAFIAPTLYDLTDGPLGSFGMSAAMGTVLFLYAASQVRAHARSGELPPSPGPLPATTAPPAH